MKVISWVFLVVLTTIGWSCGSAKPGTTALDKSLPNTVFWEITSKDLKAPSYLLGTIHIIPEDMFFWPDAFQVGLDASHQIVMETNELDMDPAAMFGIMPKIMLPDEQSLRDLVTEDEYEVINRFFGKMGLPLPFFDKIKPFFLYMFVDIDVNTLFNDGFKSYELEIGEKARAANKPLLGLETLEFQIGLFDAINFEDQADMLVQAILDKETHSGEKDEKQNQLFHTYVEQDLNAIEETIRQTDSMNIDINALLVENRNRAWIPKIEEWIHQMPTFIAVGAAHLPGEVGVLRLLQEAGYTLKPIMTRQNGID